jgi:hypothetical protein
VKVVACRPAWVRTSNRFTALFSEALQRAGGNVREFSWAPGGVFAPNDILIRWPDEFFTASSKFEHAKVAFNLMMPQAAKHVFGVRRLVWSGKALLDALDYGVIYLSRACSPSESNREAERTWR